MMFADPLLRWTDDASARPLPDTLISARADVLAAVSVLESVADADLSKEWAWTGGGG